MAGTITTALSNAFKVQLLKGNHDFDTSMRVILLKEEENLSTNYGRQLFRAAVLAQMKSAIQAMTLY
jgi:hypothetical protein